MGNAMRVVGFFPLFCFRSQSYGIVTTRSGHFFIFAAIMIMFHSKIKENGKNDYSRALLH